MFGLSTIAIKAIAAAAILAAVTAAYMGWVSHQRNVGRAEVRAEWAESDRLKGEAEREMEKLRRLAASKASAGHESDKTAIQTKFVTITERVTNEIEKPIYRNVCFPTDGVRELNAAIAATGAAADTAEPVNPVPYVKPAQ